MKKKILIVEASGLSNVLAKAFSTATPETEVKELESGSDALAALAQEQFDFVLTGYQRPGADGLEVVTQARRYSPDSVIVLMTGDFITNREETARKYGANHFLIKPFSLIDLLHTLGFTPQPAD